MIKACNYKLSLKYYLLKHSVLFMYIVEVTCVHLSSCIFCNIFVFCGWAQLSCAVFCIASEMSRDVPSPTFISSHTICIIYLQLQTRKHFNYKNKLFNQTTIVELSWFLSNRTSKCNSKKVRFYAKRLYNSAFGILLFWVWHEN